jgi:hypothetical protein
VRPEVLDLAVLNRACRERLRREGIDVVVVGRVTHFYAYRFSGPVVFGMGLIFGTLGAIDGVAIPLVGTVSSFGAAAPLFLLVPVLAYAGNQAGQFLGECIEAPFCKEIEARAALELDFVDLRSGQIVATTHAEGWVRADWITLRGPYHWASEALRRSVDDLLASGEFRGMPVPLIASGASSR